MFGLAHIDRQLSHLRVERRMVFHASNHTWRYFAAFALRRAEWLDGIEITGELAWTAHARKESGER